MKKMYFVTCNTKEEIAVIKKLKPPNILLSYHYFKNRNLKEWCEMIGYQPYILLDSGAYSAFTKNKNIALVDYIQYVNNNKEYIGEYISLDVIGDAEFSWWYYKTMKIKGLMPIPCFHYGDDEIWLQKYINEDKETYIALGGTVPEKNKTKIADWINELIERYPSIKFHLLGSSSKKITQGCLNLYSSDSSTWIMMAIMGKPKGMGDKTPQGKIERAEYHMLKIMDECNI